MHIYFQFEYMANNRLANNIGRYVHILSPHFISVIKTVNAQFH